MISKKELLHETGISYGQLYRWKREGLIPEEWFIKQSATTGQETYFKRELVIPRIQKILELKDMYQLDELKQFFKPEDSKSRFTVREAVVIDEVDPIIIKVYVNRKQSRTLSAIELAVMYILSTNKDIIDFETYSNYDFSVLDDPNLIVYFLEDESSKRFIMVLSKVGFIDPKLKIVREIRIDDALGVIAQKLKEDK